MQKKLILHIGSPKTGTTFLQDAFASNKDVLFSRGIYYHGIPGLYCANHWWFSLPFIAAIDEYDPCKWDMERGVSKKDLIERGQHSLDAFEVACADPNLNLLVVSAEQFLGLPSEVLIKMKDYLFAKNISTSILCYFRNPVSYAVSEISQKVKMGLSTLPEMLDHPPVQSVASFKRFIEIFGNKSVVARSYDRACAREGGILFDFIEALGCNDPAEFIYSAISQPQRDSNSSLSGTSLVCIDLVNRYLSSPPHSDSRESLIKSFLAVDKQLSLNGISLGEREHNIILQESKSDAQWLNANYHLDLPVHDLEFKPTNKDSGKTTYENYACDHKLIQLCMAAAIAEILTS